MTRTLSARPLLDSSSFSCGKTLMSTGDFGGQCRRHEVSWPVSAHEVSKTRCRRTQTKRTRGSYLPRFHIQIGFTMNRKKTKTTLRSGAKSWGEDIDHHTRQLLIVTVDKKGVDVSPPSKIGDSERSKGSDSSRNCLRM